MDLLSLLGVLDGGLFFSGTISPDPSVTLVFASVFAGSVERTGPFFGKLRTITIAKQAITRGIPASKKVRSLDLFLFFISTITFNHNRTSASIVCLLKESYQRHL